MKVPELVKCHRCGQKKELFRDIYKYADGNYYCLGCKRGIPRDILYGNYSDMDKDTSRKMPIGKFGCYTFILVIGIILFAVVGSMCLMILLAMANEIWTSPDISGVILFPAVCVTIGYILISFAAHELYKIGYFKKQSKFFSMFGKYRREEKMAEKKDVSKEPRVIISKKESFERLEKKIGVYWLNRIGIALIVIGLGFFAGYAFTKITALTKTVISYIAGIGILAGGIFLEKKDKFKWYGRSMIGGGWAALCFITFAMYHFNAMKILPNQLTDVFLLAVVITIMTAHLQKYRSQIITGIAFFLGYVTACMSDISLFTLIYCTALAMGLLTLIYKMKWARMLLVAIFLTYITHIFWFKPYLRMSFIVNKTISVPLYQYCMSVGFLTLYWLLFIISSIILKQEDERLENAINVCNAGFYSLFLLVETNIIRPEWKFFTALYIGLVYLILALMYRYYIKRKNISLINAFIGISFVTISFPLKFSHNITNILWAIEVPILLYIGILYERIVYRIIAWILSLIVCSHLLDMYNVGIGIQYITLHLSERLLNSVIVFLCFILSRIIYSLLKPKRRMVEVERTIMHLYTICGVLLFFHATYTDVNPSYLSLVWAAGIFIIFLCGFLVKDLLFRFLALISLAILIVRIFFFDLRPTSTIYRMLLFFVLGILLMLISFIYTKMLAKKEQG